MQAEVHSLMMEQTKDLSLKELPQFSKSHDMMSIQGMPQTPRMQQLREHLEQLCRPSARTSRTEIPQLSEVLNLSEEDIKFLQGSQ